MSVPRHVWWLLGGAALAVLVVPTATPVPVRWAPLNGLHPGVRARFLALLNRIEAATGGRVVITSAHRPADVGSYHFFGLALDVNVEFPDYALRMATPKAAWEASGVPGLIRAAGLRWGGDFVSTPYDPVHLDAGRDYPMARLHGRALALALAAGKSLTTIDGRTVALSA